jgi:hypothetical protein
MQVDKKSLLGTYRPAPVADIFAAGIFVTNDKRHQGIIARHAVREIRPEGPITLLPLLVGRRFQLLFHSPPGVLFTFPSRYQFTIGR